MFIFCKGISYGGTYLVPKPNFILVLISLTHGWNWTSWTKFSHSTTLILHIYEKTCIFASQFWHIDIYFKEIKHFRKVLSFWHFSKSICCVFTCGVSFHIWDKEIISSSWWPHLWLIIQYWKMQTIPNNFLQKAWDYVNTTFKWSTNWPRLHRLWQEALIIFFSIIIYERGFLKQKLSRTICVTYWNRKVSMHWYGF